MGTFQKEHNGHLESERHDLLKKKSSLNGELQLKDGEGSFENTYMDPEHVEKFKFTSTFSTYMTLLGYSIGMSDFWRFPFLAYRNGGGMF